MEVLKPRTTATLTDILRENRIVVLDFYAPWCQPCKQASPEFNRLPAEFTDVKFVGIDIDQEELSDAKRHFQVNGIPLFMVIADNQVVLRLDGYDRSASGTFPAIREKLKQLLPPRAERLYAHAAQLNIREEISDCRPRK